MNSNVNWVEKFPPSGFKISSNSLQNKPAQKKVLRFYSWHILKLKVFYVKHQFNPSENDYWNIGLGKQILISLFSMYFFIEL